MFNIKLENYFDLQNRILECLIKIKTSFDVVWSSVNNLYLNFINENSFYVIVSGVIIIEGDYKFVAFRVLSLTDTLSGPYALRIATDRTDVRQRTYMMVQLFIEIILSTTLLLLLFNL